MKLNLAVVLAGIGFLWVAPAIRGQEAPVRARDAKLTDLLAEADRNNSEIQSARHEWEAAKQVPSQVSTLPDPQFSFQQLSVGSPRPFAGFTNSDFAYAGIGISQDIPYPGKLRLRGDLARKDAEVTEQKYESVRREVATDVQAAYFRLSYLAEKGKILQSDQQLLKQVEQSSDARYRTGSGNMQEVLQAQLEQTKLLRETAMNDLEAGKLQAELKGLLNRSQTSEDIEPGSVSETALTYTLDQLLDAARANNPEIAAAKKMTEKQGVQVALAKKDFYPDFNIQYAWQRTDPAQFRAYYMLTLGVRVPIYRNRRQQPELEQAKAEESRARSDLDAEMQKVNLEVRQLQLSAEKSAELLKIYRDGLQPQARAELQAGLAAYQSNRQDFQALLASFLDVLKLDEEYWHTLSERETSIARIEQITGLSLR